MSVRSKIFFISTFLSFFVGFTSTFAFTGSGDGTEFDPYQITTCAQLQEISSADINEINHYTLAQDIDCSDTINWNSGLGFEPIGTLVTPFEPVVTLTGSTGHKITNLYINRPEQDYVGIFGYSLSELTVEGIGLINPTIVGHNYVGAFGGILASSSPYMFRTYTNGGSVTGNNYVGGLVGAGETLGIEESFSSTIVTGVSNVGGVMGESLGGANFTTNVYYDSERSEQSDTGKGTPQTHTEMLTLSTYGGFVFNTIWGMEDGVTYPYLGAAEVAATITPPVLEDGTEEHPYLISTCVELQDIDTSDLGAHYKLTQNIDCSDTINWNSGLGFEPIGDTNNPFYGTLNGNNYEVQHLYINLPDDPAGLFDTLGSAHVYDLKVTDADITGNFAGILASFTTLNFPSVQNNIISNVNVDGDVSGRSLLGGIFGETRNSIISDSSARVDITSTDTSTEYFGGIAGSLQDGDIVRTFATGTIATDAGTRIGGLVGFSLNGSIYNTYADVDVVGAFSSGGLVGWLDTSDLENSYSIGSVSGEGGGLVGVAYDSSITSSYYDSQTSGKSDVNKGTPKTTSQMKVSTTFSNWDFDTVWGIEQTSTYPYLNDPGTNGQIPETEIRSRNTRTGSSGAIKSPVITGESQMNTNLSSQLPVNGGGGGLTVEQAAQALLAITQSFNRNLSLGFEGEDTKKLQYFLISENTGPAALELAKVGATGYFGNLTQQALIEFQKANQITGEDGYVGPKTKDTLK